MGKAIETPKTIILLRATSPYLRDLIINSAGKVLSLYSDRFNTEFCSFIILSFVQAAVSLAVVIPCLLELQEQGYGINKGIPTLVMAAASFDNVLCISAFGVCLGIAFDSGELANTAIFYW